MTLQENCWVEIRASPFSVMVKIAGLSIVALLKLVTLLTMPMAKNTTKKNNINLLIEFKYSIPPSF